MARRQHQVNQVALSGGGVCVTCPSVWYLHDGRSVKVALRFAQYSQDELYCPESDSAADYCLKLFAVPCFRS